MLDPIRLCCFKLQSEHDSSGVCPNGTVMCAYCFERIAPEELWVDQDGKKWDVCKPCKHREDEIMSNRSQE